MGHVWVCDYAAAGVGAVHNCPCSSSDGVSAQESWPHLSIVVTLRKAGLAPYLVGAGAGEPCSLGDRLLTSCPCPRRLCGVNGRTTKPTPVSLFREKFLQEVNSLAQKPSHPLAKTKTLVRSLMNRAELLLHVTIAAQAGLTRMTRQLQMTQWPAIPTHMPVMFKEVLEAAEKAQWFRALVALPEDPSWSPKST